VKELVRFDARDMRQDRVEQLQEWVRGLGVDPAKVRSKGLISEGQQSYELHLSETVRDDTGATVLDHAIDDIVSRPLVVDLGHERSWPQWLNSPDTEGVYLRAERPTAWTSRPGG
jgi:hypothetical protein